MESTFMIHKPGSHRVNIDQLRNLPAPEIMGPRHRPIPHHQLVDTITDQVYDRGWSIKKQEYAVARKGKMLFGLMDLRGPDSSTDIGPAFGFRSSVNQTFAIRGVAGARVFVCDNMSLSGSEFVMQHKLTTRLNLPFLVSAALDKFILQSQILQEDLEALKARPLGDHAVKQILFDVFDKGALPLHLFDDVSKNYFRPETDHIDCQPRNAWGLHNACTRAVKVLSPMAQFKASVSVGRQFKLAAPRYIAPAPSTARVF